MFARACATCLKIRAALAGAWQRVVVGRYCVVQGCRGSYPICRRHFNMLPLKLRQRWWQETDYSGRAPNRELIDEVNRRAAPKA